jgi:hypothetical protein
MKPLVLHREQLAVSISLGFILCLSMLLPACKDDNNNPVQPQTPTNPFVGSWKLVKFNGQVYAGTTLTWTFTDTTVDVSTSSQSYSGTYSYDSTVAPKTVDVRLTGTTPNPNLAVYKVVPPDTLVLKLMDGASARSANFNVEQGYDLEEFKKQ